MVVDVYAGPRLYTLTSKFCLYLKLKIYRPSSLCPVTLSIYIVNFISLYWLILFYEWRGLSISRVAEERKLRRRRLGKKKRSERMSETRGSIALQKLILLH